MRRVGSVERTVGVGDDISEHPAHVESVDVSGVFPVGGSATPGVDVLAVADDELVTGLEPVEVVERTLVAMGSPYCLRAAYTVG